LIDLLISLKENPIKINEKSEMQAISFEIYD